MTAFWWDLGARYQSGGVRRAVPVSGVMGKSVDSFLISSRAPSAIPRTVFPPATAPWVRQSFFFFSHIILRIVSDGIFSAP